MDKKNIIKFNIIAIICIIIFCVTLSQKTLQNDTFYTIKIGEHIVETKTIDMKDPFSVHRDLKYTYPHWLYDIGMYGIYSIGSNIAENINYNTEDGGLTAIYISTIIFTTILGILIYYSNIKICKNYVLSFILTLGVIYCLKNFMAARAQLVTFILFTLEILCIEQLLNSGKKRYGVALFIIAVTIANLHSAVWYLFFILTLPYIAEFLVIHLMESNLSCNFKMRIIKIKLNRLKNKCIKDERNTEKIEKKIEKLNIKYDELNNLKERRKNAVEKMQKNSIRFNYDKRSNIKILIIVLIFCIFSGLLTPQTSFEPYTHLFKLLKGNSTQSISEHSPTVLINSIETLVILTIVFTMFVLTNAKISLKDIFMLLGLFVLTLISRRQLSILATVGVYSLNIFISNFIRKYDNTNIEYQIINKIITKFGTTIVILLVISCGINFYGKKNKEPYIDKSSYPVNVSEYILNNLDINNIRLYNSYNFGSYLLYRGIPVFIDSRCDLYTPEFNEKDIFSDSLNIDSIAVYYEDKFEEYGITHVITYDDSKLKMLLEHDNNYRCMYRDDDFYLFERTMVHEGENN